MEQLIPFCFACASRVNIEAFFATVRPTTRLRNIPLVSFFRLVCNIHAAAHIEKFFFRPRLRQCPVDGLTDSALGIKAKDQDRTRILVICQRSKKLTHR